MNETAGEDSICAIATPLGEGGVGIVRISGDQAILIAAKFVRPKNHTPLEKLSSHRLYLSDVFSKENFPLDEALVVIMRRPYSYTGEDVVEIQTHGGPFIMQTTCDALIQEGARIAEPGEFTKRAFLNGRLDLIQAEAVLDTIQATTTNSLRSAQGLLRGTLSREVEELKDELIRNLAHLEAGMDFVEEDISFIKNEQLGRVFQETQAKLQRMIDTFEEGRMIREGIQVAIIGRPNVGKSSLLNVLLKTDRAIVSSVPGTTRDVIDECVNLSGFRMRLLDTAGLRKTEDLIEEEGMRRTREVLEEADLLLLVLDSSEALTEEDRLLLKEYGRDRCLILLNKSDLHFKMEIQEILNAMSSEYKKTEKFESINNAEKILKISVKSEKGLDLLKETIRKCFFRGKLEIGQGPIVTHLRHKAALAKAQESILQAQTSIQAGMDGECIAFDMRAALDSLGEITGAVCTEDILDRIFRDFCIGK